MHRLEETKQYIEQKEGIYIKYYYKNEAVHLEYKCKNNHIIHKRIDHITKHWCVECIYDTNKQKMFDTINENGIKLLSNEYTNCGTKYNWQYINCGHIIENTFTSLKQCKFRCKQCNSYTLQDIINAALSKQGKCLSTKFTNCQDKYLFECVNKHQWKTRGSNVLNGYNWCPKCRESVEETTCRKILEFIYKKQFPKTKPEWLLSKRKTRLELDCYNEELKIACEYNGEQHYNYVDYFHKSEESFEKRKLDDQQKIELCKQKGIHLIIVPYTVKHQDLYTHILQNAINIPENTPDTIDYSILNLSNTTNKIQEIQEYLDNNHPGSKILSDVYEILVHI